LSDNITINGNSKVAVEVSALDEAYAFLKNVVSALGNINVALVSAGVVFGVGSDLDVEVCNLRATVGNLGPGNLNTAFVFLDLSVDIRSARLLRRLEDLLVGNF